MEVQRIKVSPEIAMELLSKNENNRPLRPVTVATYATDMAYGRWQLNGETIKISRCGRLLDGQHRLAAVIKSNCTIDALVATEIDPDAFRSIDTGMKRTTAQILTMKGEKYATHMSSIARWVIFLTNGNKQVTISVGEVEQIIDHMPTIRDFSFLIGGRKKLSRFPSLIMAPGVVFSFHFPVEKIKQFYDKLETGDAIGRGHPAYELRERLLGLRNGKSLQPKTVAALTVKALKAHCYDKKIFTLKWTENEEFPSIL